MLKVHIVADTDGEGNLKPVLPRHIGHVDASACGDELAAVQHALKFMEKQDLAKLLVVYGRGRINLNKEDNPVKKADELFYESCAFDLYRIKSFKDPEFNLGEPIRANNIDDAARSALCVSKRFGVRVSFTFNNIAVPPVEQKGEITRDDVLKVTKAYNRAFDAHRRR